MIRLSKRDILIRWYLFIVGVIMMCLASYFLAFNKTFELYTRYNEVNEQKTNASKSHQVNVNQYEVRLVNKIIDRYSVDTLVIKEKLLDEFSRLCSKFSCKITSIGETEQFDEYGLSVINNEIELEGSYFQLLMIMNEIENHNLVGKINSSEIYVVNDFVNKVTKLRMKLFIQNIEKNENL